jgi:hypothetical protein
MIQATQEAFCSQEVAKLLEEKGFIKDCARIHAHCNPYDPYLIVDMLIAPNTPTHQTAMRWLREVHNKHCDVGYDIDLKWFFQIIDLEETIEYDYPETKYYHDHTANESGFNSYEEAVEAALKYVLENLI